MEAAIATMKAQHQQLQQQISAEIEAIGALKDQLNIKQQSLFYLQDQFQKVDIAIKTLTSEFSQLSVVDDNNKVRMQQAQQFAQQAQQSAQQEQQKEIWDTLGQPSGKFDYMVKYSAPPSASTPMESITASGWDNEIEKINKGFEKILQNSSQEKYYVIFNGPMKGCYDAWEKAAPYVIGQSQIIHKSFKTLDEAKMAFEEFTKQHPEQSFVRREGKAPVIAKSSSFPRSKGMSIDLVQKRAEANERRRVCRKNLQTTLSKINSWTEEKKTVFGYYPTNKEQLTKLVVFPETSPEDAYQFFLYGLIDTILLFKDLSVLNEFPQNLVETIKRFKEMVDKDCVRDICLRFISSQPIFDQEGDCIIPAYHIIFISVFPGRFPEPGEMKSFEDYEDKERLAGSLARIFYKTEKWTKDSHIRINYSSKNCILYSNQKKTISPREWNSVIDLESTFYSFEGSLSRLPHEVKRRLCFLLSNRENHECTLCTKKMDESPFNKLSAEEDKGILEMVPPQVIKARGQKTETAAVAPHQEEKDETSSSDSLDIIV